MEFNYYCSISKSESNIKNFKNLSLRTSIWYVRKIFRKTIISYPLIRVRAFRTNLIDDPISKIKYWWIFGFKKYKIRQK